ncbi:MAG: hypothetical protein M1833_005392 [Piccolia ochrophora]|nr:MAG: hypothetical protein M1833_005392 [Piccolia ochrophora]
MGKPFFTGWELWQKMCFILACGIVLTILAGFIKLSWSHWRIRKYTAIDEASKSHLREMRQSRHVIQLKGEDVPFGVRAIESGIEVDGVWISRPNSPALTSSDDAPRQSSSNELARPPASVDASPQKRMTSTLDVYRLSSQPPALGHQTAVSRPPSALSLPLSNPFEHMSPPESQLSRSSSGESGESRGSTAQVSPPASSPEAPSEEQDINETTFFLEDDDDLSKPRIHEKGPREFRKSAFTESDVESNGEAQSEGSPGSSLESYRKSTLHPQQPPKVHHPRAAASAETLQDISVDFKRTKDLEDMFNHRVSHAAEVGQLRPRARRSVIGNAYVGLNTSPNRKSAPTGDFFTSKVPLPRAKRGAGPFEDPLKSPEMESLDLEVPKIRIICSTPTDTFDKGVPAVVVRSKTPSPTTETQRHTIAFQPSDVAGSPYLHENKTIRKVNSGFEVLPAGTFITTEEIKASLPRSEEWYKDLEAGEGGQPKPRRLQKKRRPKSTF